MKNKNFMETLYLQKENKALKVVLLILIETT